MTSPGGPAVSVITIFLDAERFLEESILSVLDQTLGDLELILVDDGSTDGGTRIARSYAERFAGRIRCVEHAGHANLGMSASRNAGLRESRGRLVAFLDADDLWAPTMLEESVAFLEGHPGADLTYSGSTYWHGWTGRPEDAALDREWKPGVDTGVLFPAPTLLTRILGDGWLVPCPGTFLVRREFAHRIGGFEDRFRRQFDDQAFLAKALLHGTAVVSDSIGHRYRQHRDSDGATAARAGIVAAARIDYFAWLDGYVRRHGFGDPALRRALDAARAEAGPPAPGPEPGPPPVGNVGFGDFRRVTPFSRLWGFDRGSPVDRRYIEAFLERNSADIRGTVLEVKDPAYTLRFGGDAVIRSEVLDLTPTESATIVADLQDGRSMPESRFDCVILTQTLQLVYDFRAALDTVRRILKPGGVVLLTVPGISQLDHAEAPDSWYWSFTPRSVRRLLEEGGWKEIDVEGNGNVLTSMAFLYGMAGRELSEAELSEHDPDYPMLITARARTPPLD
ncbi:MAG TPA: glycosyltransferase [Gemmatimonadota bacterium]